MPPQSPSRYIRRRDAAARLRRPVAPAVSKSLHSCGPTRSPPFWSGCPRSLQVATFGRRHRTRCSRVRLPPQSPSRYILRAAFELMVLSPVAPAVSKSLHSHRLRPRLVRGSGCPRSLQVATFPKGVDLDPPFVRLPPQSPSRYIPLAVPAAFGLSPVAPAVSKSLHSIGYRARGPWLSGCPRSLQVATFEERPRALQPLVRLPPQSPSRYIRPPVPIPARARPVAPAVSKSLHSDTDDLCALPVSGCPRSLQVATFPADAVARGLRVRLPPQSPSRYIRPGRCRAHAESPVAPAVSKSLHSRWQVSLLPSPSGCPRSLQVATFPA